MIFSSFEFLLIFLPIAIVVYYLSIKFLDFIYAKTWIFLTSLFYYAYWDISNLGIIIFSICFNYILGDLIVKNNIYQQKSKFLFIFGLFINLSLLAFYKYTNFALENINYLFQSNIPYTDIILPIGISFFTFQQISYLSDLYTKKYIPQEKNFSEYCCFVCFFPQLVAGPIVHHNEMMPQFGNNDNHKVKPNFIYAGIVTFSIGLFKKVCLADNLSPIARYCFDDISSLTFFEAILGSLTYTLQLYFDFSGYADMAIGCALFFNIRLPENFYYPYLATNIQDFWRRWHITLSRWLRNYLYIPLGGNRISENRTYFNVFITFLIGGIWHGAAWTFVLWGILHGLALIIQQLWSKYVKFNLPRLISWIITFSFVNVAWIVFRAVNFERLGVFSSALLGENGLYITSEFYAKLTNLLNFSSINEVFIFMSLAFLLSIVKTNFFSVDSLLKKPSAIATLSSIFLLITSILIMARGNTNSEFIYFQF